MAGFGTPLRAGQVLASGRLQRMQQGAFIETTSQGEFTGEIIANTNPTPNDFDTCRWMRTGRVGAYWWTSIFPGGFDNGSGGYVFRVPFRPDLEYIRPSGQGDYGHRVGDGRLRDNSASGNSEVVVAQFFITAAPESVLGLTGRGTNSFVGENIPFTFAADDAIAFRSRYPVDPRTLP